MPQFGSNPSVASQNLSATQDPNGNPIISSDNSFGVSPLGVAARTQTLYGIPNANFDLTCPDPNSAVEVNNSIPYWSLEASGTISTTMVYNTTAQNWSVRMDPTGAASGDYAILKTRTFLLNDDALALRQKAYASLTKQGTTGTAQWSIVLSATYYDDTGAILSTYNIGTAADTGTWTGINGITTSGSAAISTTAAYADIALTLTAAGSVSGTAKVDINSVLIATSQAAGGGSFLLTQTFTSSGTWTRPTGVEYVSVVAVSGGNGGNGGQATIDNTGGGITNPSITAGNPGAYVLVKDLYIGTATTISVGVGAGGAGGVGGTATKLTGTQTVTSTAAADGGQGGNTTFGSYIAAYSNPSNGDGSGNAGSVSVVAPFSDVVTDRIVYSRSGTTVTANSYFVSNGFTSLPFQTHTVAAGQNGSAGTALGATTGGRIVTGGVFSLGGSAGTGGNVLSGGGAMGQARVDGSYAYAYIGTALPTTSGTTYAGNAVGGAGGGGGSGAYRRTNTGTVQATGGNGGSASANSSSGGGAGGQAYASAVAGTAVFQTVVGTAIGGNGGPGGSGYCIVAWVG